MAQIKESRKRSLAKAMSWRVIAMFITMVVSYFVMKEEAATAVDVANTRALVFDTVQGFRYGQQSATDLVAGPWTAVGAWTLVGTGSAVNVFDPSPPDPDTERHYRIFRL